MSPSDKVSTETSIISAHDVHYERSAIAIKSPSENDTIKADDAATQEASIQLQEQSTIEIDGLDKDATPGIMFCSRFVRDSLFDSGTGEELIDGLVPRTTADPGVAAPCATSHLDLEDSLDSLPGGLHGALGTDRKYCDSTTNSSHSKQKMELAGGSEKTRSVPDVSSIQECSQVVVELDCLDGHLSSDLTKSSDPSLMPQATRSCDNTLSTSSSISICSDDDAQIGTNSMPPSILIKKSSFSDSPPTNHSKEAAKSTKSAKALVSFMSKKQHGPKKTISSNRTSRKLSTVSTSTNVSNSEESNERRDPVIKFATVTVRNYSMALGDHPGCKFGPPVSIGWDYIEAHPLPIDEYESNLSPHQQQHRRERQQQPPRRRLLAPPKKNTASEFYMNSCIRRKILEEIGCSMREQSDAIASVQLAQRQRKESAADSIAVIRGTTSYVEDEEKMNLAMKKRKSVGEAVSRKGLSKTLGAARGLVRVMTVMKAKTMTVMDN
mmetsp:Transcript_24645/g.49801  ORF Transcript_24645/g.49801 Transcript_24645/m.49801 type:complete len:495 (+) Transcript_24645:347-1831(+)